MTRYRALTAALLLPTFLLPTLLSGASAVAQPTAAGATSWSVAPADTGQRTARPYFDYNLAPGTTITDAFSVRNNGSAGLTLNVYAADAFTTREGTIDLLAGDKESTDSGKWVTIGASTVTLQPGEGADIPFSLTVPTTARPGDHPGGIVASLVSDDPNSQVQVDHRLGSRLYVRVSGELVPSVATSDLAVAFSGSWNPLAIGSLEVSYRLQNTGNTRITATTAVEASGPLGVASTTGKALQLPEVLPGSEIDVHQTVSGVGALLWLAGAVDLRPSSVGIGATELDAVALDYGIPAVPFTLLGILVVIALIVVAIMLLRRRRAKRAGIRPASVPTEA
ncbi:DUF916 domain-containing protein [soil metagenome]